MNKWLHWVNDNHICKYCGQNLLSPYTTSDCPSRPISKRPKTSMIGDTANMLLSIKTKRNDNN